MKGYGILGFPGRVHRFNARMLCLPVLFCLIFASQALSQERGSINGTVVDASDGAPLPGTNILIKGTVLGTSASRQGEFILDRLQPGTYSVMASMIGYKIQTFEGVTVVPGFPVTLNFKLEESFVEADAIVVTASRKARSLSETPNSISVVSAMDIRKRNSVDVRDALKYAPGVTFIGDQVNIRGTTGFSRGAGSRVLLLTDGVPTMPGDSGSIKWDLVPFTAVEKVEVVKGAASALYGSSAISGVLNVITREPSDHRVISVRSSGGFFEQPRFLQWDWTSKTLFTNQQDIYYSNTRGNFGYVLAGGRRNSRGFKQNSQFQRWNIYGKGKVKATANLNLTFTGSYAVDDHGDSIQWQQYLGQVKQPFLAPQGEEKNTTVSTKVYLNATASQLVDQNLALQFKASYFRNHFRNDFVDNQDVSTSERFRAEYQANVEPSIHHSLVFGIQGTYDVVDGSIFGERKALVSGSYIQDEIKVTDHFLVSAGLRLDISQVISGNTESEVSPKFGFLYDLSDVTKLRGSLGRGFRAPSIAELFTSTSASGFRVIPNPGLKAESSWSAELGFNTIIGGRFLVDVAVYQERYFDFINPSIGLNNKLQLEIQFNNVQDARLRGIESNVRSSWFRNRLHTVVTYIFVDPRDLDNDQLLSYRPQHLLTTSASLKLGLFEFGLDYRFASKLKQEQLEVFPDDPRIASKLFDARTGVSIGSTTVMLNVENLFNYHSNQVERNLEPTRKISISWQSDF